MAWKRGVSNNQAGVIRKGQIREFLIPSSKQTGISATLTIINTESFARQDITNVYQESAYALFSSSSDLFTSCISPSGMLYLHSHEHPRCVVLAIQSDSLPPNSILLNEAQRVNSKVCTGEREVWTIYQGDMFAYDAREGAIGDTSLRRSLHLLPMLIFVYVDVRPKAITTDGLVIDVDSDFLSVHLAKAYFNCIVSLEELISVTLPNDQQIVCRISEIVPELNEEDTEDELTLPDHYRGLVIASTSFRVVSTTSTGVTILAGAPELPRKPPAGVVSVLTKDDEVFPVKRRLLRPCISLTSVVQEGRGKYRTVTCDEPSARVDVDACTFDRVLLYLEHEARDEEFKFDPLLASELLEAANVLGIAGLADAASKILGSFQTRVRRSPIRMDEVVSRNRRGSAECSGSRRSETLLVLDGMVLDVSRWLYEHPGGGTIIPQQALDGDCAVFFELYHNSRQSFLYLKEFYIGELDTQDRRTIKHLSPDGVLPSGAFLEQLRRVTTWRLQTDDLVDFEIHKSF